MASAPAFLERYGEAFDPRTGMGDVEVWVPVEKQG
jgi:predicted transcriptional regulator YdeE